MDGETIKLTAHFEIIDNVKKLVDKINGELDQLSETYDALSELDLDVTIDAVEYTNYFEVTATNTVTLETLLLKLEKEALQCRNTLAGLKAIEKTKRFEIITPI